MAAKKLTAKRNRSEGTPGNAESRRDAFRSQTMAKFNGRGNKGEGGGKLGYSQSRGR